MVTRSGRICENGPLSAQPFKDDLRSIFSFFDNSASRSTKLHVLQKLLGDPELKMAKVGDTRWLRFAPCRLHCV